MPETLIPAQNHVLFARGGERGDLLGAALSLCVEVLEAVEYCAPGDVCEWCGHGGEESASHRERGHAADCRHGQALALIRGLIRP
jgi:hypothetical protein